ncbi:hypothetical protein DAPPUDRAFT_257285 [Daphnia pulex]|uniref:Uncharacterized protein n=1 Tax=Daphnia pulex TaxID=6669 RepID=E9HD94_DAPPU|nr:hypothetical protein DAPPUDRAFT_257285 [Daphnia pulex]|eukprot:EFX70286.1 hypothetical protein DAPPUDRAFT_257285 [Daphnia pulex]
MLLHSSRNLYITVITAAHSQRICVSGTTLTSVAGPSISARLDAEQTPLKRYA